MVTSSSQRCRTFTRQGHRTACCSVRQHAESQIFATLNPKPYINLKP